MEGVAGTDYQLILADPPWAYERNRIKHYKTMTQAELCAMPVESVAAKDSVLAIWATFPKLPEALETINAWGFKYTTQLFTWIKTTGNGTPFLGTGHYTRGNAELLLLGKRGNGVKRRRRNISSVLFSKRREHSRKPDEVRDLLTDLFGNDTKRLELFARSRTGGWDAHGAQVNKFSGQRSHQQARLTNYFGAKKGKKKKRVKGVAKRR
jgi:site-specific DNA-methyltransferase (adenine-specific)